MSNLWLRIKVWTKVILIVLVAGYVLVFVAKNSEKQVGPWLFYNREPQISLLTLTLLCFLLGALSVFLIGTTMRTVKQVRELREKGRTIKAERELAEMKAKAGRLQARAETAPVAPVALVDEDVTKRETAGE